jgi:quaternary ammonium compound-resistance protein SugE
MLPWILLVLAGLLEVVWAIGLKQTAGFTRLWPSVITIAAMIASFLLLARVMQSLPLGISYTVWVGIGAVGSVIAGVTLFGERLGPLQVVCISAIALGIVGLKALPGPRPTQPGLTQP